MKESHKKDLLKIKEATNCPSNYKCIEHIVGDESAPIAANANLMPCMDCHAERCPNSKQFGKSKVCYCLLRKKMSQSLNKL